MLLRKLATVVMGCIFFMSMNIAYADDLPVAPKKKWTFMVFLNGNNNLDRFGKENIKGMEKVGSNDEVNIIVQWASLRQGKVTRLYIQKSDDPYRVTSPVIQDLGRVDMGSYKSLEDFIQWTVEHYPADHYFVDVWNHGGGWEKNKMAHASRDISWDELTGNKITTEELGVAMNFAATVIGHKVDIYGSDACLMGMAEVANEMADSVHYFVGSQELEPGEGWPYAPFLARWQATKNADAVQVSRILTEEFVKAYSPGGIYPSREVTFSAFNLEGLPALNQAMRNLGETIRQVNPEARQEIINRAGRAMTFGYSDYADLLDLIALLNISDSKLSLNSQHLNDVTAATKNLVVANMGTSEYARATGISIWMPLNSYSYKARADRYQHLRFSMNSGWGETLGTLLQGVGQQQQQQQLQPQQLQLQQQQ